ncbi:Uncharacterised protein [Shigella dysenteriae]|nr:Uncharacterised protein [Shigella dysenteriae]
MDWQKCSGIKRSYLAAETIILLIRFSSFTANCRRHADMSVIR